MKNRIVAKKIYVVDGSEFTEYNEARRHAAALRVADERDDLIHFIEEDCHFAACQADASTAIADLLLSRYDMKRKKGNKTNDKDRD